MNKGSHLDRTPAGVLSETRRVLIDRDRVLALDKGLPILVIEGPSGYGKTSLAEMWLERQCGQGQRCWVSMDASSSDPVRFLQQLLYAVGADGLDRQEAEIDEDAARAERFGRLCTRLTENDIAFRIVIDDAHLIAASPSRADLEKLLELASARLRFCLTAQPVPLEIGLGRLAARGNASWIQGKCLALSQDEVARFAALQGQQLSAHQLDWLYRATEGWPVLTQLALAAPLEASTQDAEAISDSGPLREYIYERFLQGLSDDEQDVLWMLACLGSVPVALLVELEPQPAKVELALLRFRALGIVRNRDPDDPSVTSLHALVRDSVSRLLEVKRPLGRRALLREAADWYWRNGQGATAIRLALEGDAELIDRARDWLLELGFGFIFRSGQHQTFLDLVARWEHVSGKTHPALDQSAAWALIFQRQFADAEVRLTRIERDSSEQSRGSVAALHRAVMFALRDDYVAGGALALQWLQGHPGDHGFFTGVASTVYAFSLKCFAQFDRAHVALREAMYCFNDVQSTYGIGWAHVVGAIMQVQAGDYRAALAQVESGLNRCPGSQGFGSLRTLLSATEAFLHYERNELERVREVVGETLPLLSEQGVVDAVILGYTAAARARVVAGDFDTALDLLAEGEQIGLRREFPRLTFTLRAERALLLLRSGIPSQARKVIGSLPSEEGRVRTTYNLLQARLAISGGDGDGARRSLEPILARARAQGRQNRLCEILIQLALAEDLCGNERRAFSLLAEALDIASAEGYVRSFLDEGSGLHDLTTRWLRQPTGSTRPAMTLANRLVATRPRSTESGAIPAGNETSLNKRERQILGLLNEGLTNAELAKRCFISEGTVKWYLHNLYEKLGVRNRTALLRAARDRGVIL